MMRSLIAAGAAAAALLGGAAIAQPERPQVDVRYSEAFEKKLDRTYGVREKAILEDMIADNMARALGARAARVEVMLEDAVPNRPTFEQMGRTPGLSYQSFGVGGARASGRAFDATGRLIAETRYDWYSNDIQWAWNEWTWGDADTALERLARRLAKAADQGTP